MMRTSINKVMEDNLNEFIPLNPTSHHAVTKGDLAQTRTRKRKKAKDKLDDETQSKKCHLGTGDIEGRKSRKILNAKRLPLFNVQTKESQIVGSLESEEYKHMPYVSFPIFPFFVPSGRVKPIDRAVYVHKSKKDFENKYYEFKALGNSRYRSVFSGIRRSDFKLVAIKHIPIEKVKYMWVKYQDICYMEISEVVLMAQAAGHLCKGSEENRAIIGLLDVFELNEEILIVTEIPLDATDIGGFFNLRKGHIPEHEAKIIFKQLVNAALLMHKNGIFHQEIRGHNVLVSQDQGTLSIKIIEFGCGELVQEKQYNNFTGTLPFSPPELFLQKQYKAEPYTVWQIGAMLQDLYVKEVFLSRDYMEGLNNPFDHLSHDCKDFMNQCLTIDPEQRPGLEKLQRHPWLC